MTGSVLRLYLLRATWCLASLLSTSLAGTAQAATPADHEIRAAVITQALRFVAWAPESAPGDTLRVVVVGDRALSTALRQTARNVQPGGRAVIVVDVAAARQVAAAKPAVVVLGAMPEHEATALVAALSRRGVVTMGGGDCPDNRAVMLNLRPTGARYRVQANTDTAALAGINLSARLLSLAHIVN
jgi:hypothetical protein